VKSVVHIGEDERLHQLKESLSAEEIEASVILATIVKLHVRCSGRCFFSRIVRSWVRKTNPCSIFPAFEFLVCGFICTYNV
jgi:hypothetical protein